MADKTASYSIRFDSNAVQTGQEGAASLEQLKASVGKSQDAVKLLSAAMRGLKGSSDEVKAAREQLKAQLEAEKTATTAATLALLKQGTSYEQLAQKEKAARDEAAKLRKEQEAAASKTQTESIEKLRKSIEAAGGPVSELKGKISSLRDALSTSVGRAALFVGAIVAVTGAAIEAGRAIFEAARGLAEWIFEAANAARSANLMREAWTGSATNAAHLGSQVDLLASKVPIARDKLNELAGATVKALNNSRVSGQGIVDTYNAVASASSAMGDEVGSRLQSIIERSKNTGRVSIGLFELQGTGVSRDDVAQQLSKRLHVGLNDARLALLTGRVGVNDAAAAIRAAVDARFGEINAKKLLAFDAQAQRFKDNLQKLGKDVNIEPLLKDFDKIGKLIDVSTVSGQALKTIITTIGNSIGKGFGDDTVSKVKKLFLEGELMALKLLIAVYKIDNAIGRTFGKDWKGKLFGGALERAANHAQAFADALQRVSDLIDRLSGGDNLAVPTPGTKAVVRGGGDLPGTGKKLGQSITQGIAAGIKDGQNAPEDAIRNLAGGLRKSFTEALGIHSPSKVFEEEAMQVPAGVVRGVDKGAPATQQAVDRMGPKPSAGGLAPAPQKAERGGGGAKIELHVHIDAGGNQKAEQQLSSPAFLRKLTIAVEDALVNAGLPPHTPAPV